MRLLRHVRRISTGSAIGERFAEELELVHPGDREACLQCTAQQTLPYLLGRIHPKQDYVRLGNGMDRDTAANRRILSPFRSDQLILEAP